MKIPDQVEHQRIDLLRALADKRVVFQDFESDHLADIVCNILHFNFHFENDGIPVINLLKTKFDDQQLIDIYNGCQFSNLPKQLLEQLPLELRIKFFEGLGRFTNDVGSVRYNFFLKAQNFSAANIIQFFTEMSTSDNSYGIENRITHDPNITKKMVHRYKRKDSCVNDILTYFENHTLPVKRIWSSQHRTKHANLVNKVRDNLIVDGFVTYEEIEIKSLGFEGAIDIIAIKYGDFRLYECKGFKKGYWGYSHSEDQLRNSAKFFFYNFGLLPSLYLRQAYPVTPVILESPKVNKELAGIFN